MGFDKGTIPNATVVTISLLTVVGLLIAGATPAVAQSDDGPGFNFTDDGGDFGFQSGDDDTDTPGFDFGGGDAGGAPGFDFDDGDQPGFDFGNDSDQPGFNFGEDGDQPGFDFGDDGDQPGFNFGEDGDQPGFDFGEDGDQPDFGSGGDGNDGGDGDDKPNVTFVPTIDGTNSPVTEGETLTVDATVENTGTGDGLQTVTLTTDGSVRDSQQVTLSGGESTSLTFSWETESGDAGEYSASVNTATRDTKTDVTVESADPDSPANFQVSNLQAPGSATVGDTITVSADVENTGDQQGTQSVEFGVDTDDDGSLETLATQDETLAGGASTTVSFDVNTSSLSQGTYTHGVSTANDTETAEITLESQGDQPANFQIQSLSTNSPVTEGETLTVDATVQNTGDNSATQRVSLSVLGVSDTGALQLDGGETGTVTLSVDTISGDAGIDTATVTTNDDSAQTQVEVQQPGTTGTISGVVEDENSSAISGATVSAGSQSTTTAADGSYSLEVTAGDYTVTADADGYQSAEQSVSVTAGQTSTADFTLSAQSDGGDGIDLDGPTDFTGYVLGDESYLHTGTPDNDRPITYSRCRDGQPDPAEQDPGFLPTDDCITFEGTVFPSNNSWVGDVDFTPVTGIINDTQADTLANVYFEADFSTVDGARGTFDPQTGETSLETTVAIDVSIWPVGDDVFEFQSPAENPYSSRSNLLTEDECRIPNTKIVASTEKSFTTDSPFPSSSTVSGERLNESRYGKVVTDDFSVESATGCGTYFGTNLTNQTNIEQGIPAPAGENEAAYDIEIDLQGDN